MAETSGSRLPSFILIGAALGLTLGLFIGERAAVLEPLGIAYAKMLEIAVFPYLVCSLLVGLGGLARERAGRLLRASWGVYAVGWALTFLTILLLGAFIPPTPPPSVLAPDTAGAAADILDLLIPANIAVALDRNFVPAIVVFAILYSVAIQTIPQKATLLESMEVLRKASVTLWMWIVYFAPIGVFALFASTAGTVDAAAASGLVVYSVLFLAGTFILGFLVLPLLLSRLVPLRYGEILGALRPALTLALVTTLSVAALPFIQKAAEDICRREKIDGGEANDVIRATLSIAYVLSQLGNYFIALFLIYASYSNRIALTLSEWLMLPFMTLLSGIGSPSASVDAVAFLAAWLNLPATTLNLYVETMTVTRYGQVAISVMGFAFVTLAVTMIYFGRARLRLQPIAAAFCAVFILFGGLALLGRHLSERLFPPPTDAAIMARTLDPQLVAAVDAVVHRARPADLTSLSGAGTFDAIRSRGRIRVGYGADIIPFSYFNGAGDLVGYDVAAAYRFARDLHVGIEFVPIDWRSLEADLAAGMFDIVMAGAYATPDRLRQLSVSEFYLINPLALIVRADRAGQFRSYDTVAARSGLKIAVFQDPVLEPLVKGLFPKAEIVVLGSYDELPARPDIDAAIWTRDQAAAWTEARSGYTAVVPANIGAPLPFSYLMPPRSDDMQRYVDLWLRLEQTSGIRERSIDYWMRGAERADRNRRWNIVDNVIMPALGR
ncbi:MULTISPECIES: cation:dicarboxylase symporter family transporter [unclassified Chelatococcus]|uniref:cation:dicarboxylate symporter family transporter n=1 Tax=unclassified Chelatococcus TaxID=2638111 RepID=UPI001BCC2771|nr:MULTISPECIES: cation:dicarboxylase symporter family transporter [unclassified Chelatococcus]MBS7700083.1 cation:dicarboxylase symporter family transporter [Chelatococcus sp. YT9]MBX3556776.1 cation:dicarboxylase symporter family transporter [Chelatococcus sp.]